MFLDSRNHDYQVQETRILLWSGWGVQGGGSQTAPGPQGLQGRACHGDRLTQEGMSSSLRTRGDLRGVSGRRNKENARSGQGRKKVNVTEAGKPGSNMVIWGDRLASIFVLKMLTYFWINATG